MKGYIIGGIVGIVIGVAVAMFIGAKAAKKYKDSTGMSGNMSGPSDEDLEIYAGENTDNTTSSGMS